MFRLRDQHLFYMEGESWALLRQMSLAQSDLIPIHKPALLLNNVKQAKK